MKRDMRWLGSNAPPLAAGMFTFRTRATPHRGERSLRDDEQKSLRATPVHQKSAGAPAPCRQNLWRGSSRRKNQLGACAEQKV